MSDLKKLFGSLLTGQPIAPTFDTAKRGEGTEVPHSAQAEAMKARASKVLGFEKWHTTELGELLKTIEREMYAARSKNWHSPKPSDSDTYQGLKTDLETRTALARFIFERRGEIIEASNRGRSYDVNTWRGFAVFSALMRGTLDMTPEELLGWVVELKDTPVRSGSRLIHFYQWPISFMVQQVERHAKKQPLSEEAVQLLLAVKEYATNRGNNYYGTDFKKVMIRINKILADTGESDVVVPYNNLGGDAFGDVLNARRETLPEDERIKWDTLLHHAATAGASKPTKTFIANTKSMRDDMGKEWMRSTLQDWLQTAVSAKPSDINRMEDHGYGGYEWMERRLFTTTNQTLVKGLIWTCEGFQDSRTVNLVADLCERSMVKIPGIGPAAQSVANACMWYLEITPGAEATARLSRLSTAIKQKGIQKKVRALVKKKADAAGITEQQLEERVAPKYGLTDGVKDIRFDDFTRRLKVFGPGEVKQTWLKPDGTPQKTKPKFVGEKEALKAKFKKVSDDVKAMKKVLTAQRDRIDRLFAEDLTWTVEEVEEYYVGHPLIGNFTRRLIWVISTDAGETPAIKRNDVWEDVTGAAVSLQDGDAAVSLWHPVEYDVEQIVAWRERLAALEIMQPTKQAHREVYFLTDAERKTEVYSNRMAAHMLKQHQASTLMASRGWHYQIMGCYDDGLDTQFAQKSYSTSDLTAELLFHTNWDTDHWNDAGIYHYVGTDQLRFVDAEKTPVALEQVPARLFSEAMREADLFVGVASVGNDPNWHDQGPTPEARNYWQSYSFGNLNAFAETRKDVLSAILPRLKIRDVAHIDGKFLVVDGKLNTYKIHLGSSNIMMMPGDRYLCIVPGGSSKAVGVTLPFEGDARLSVILSKAFMLAEDDKITASDIVRQLKRSW